MAKKRTQTKNTSASVQPKLEPRIEKVKFKYIFDDDYNPVYANGAYGGPTTQGELTVNFYVERSPIPLEQTHSVAPDGRVAEHIGQQPSLEQDTVTVIRYITTGVILNRDTAKRVHEFLGRHLQSIEAIEAARTVIQAKQAEAKADPTGAVRAIRTRGRRV